MCITKTRAFLIHFSLSFLIFSVLFFILYYLWFPGDYFMLDGGWQGIKLIAAIDLVLGPALTLLLFKPGKPKLIFDMSMIAAIQIVALSYGFYTAYHQRTVGLVFADSEFTTISYQDLLRANDTLRTHGLAPVNLDKLGTPYPRQIMVEPLTKESFDQYWDDLQNGMPSLRERTDKYRPLSMFSSELSRSKLPMDIISIPEINSKISEIAESENKRPENYEIYKFRARYGSGIALFDPEKKRVTRLIKTKDSST